MSRICPNFLTAFKKFDITILELPEVRRKNKKINVTINDNHFHYVCKNNIKQNGIRAKNIVKQKFTNYMILTTDQPFSNFK